MAQVLDAVNKPQDPYLGFKLRIGRLDSFSAIRCAYRRVATAIADGKIETKRGNSVIYAIAGAMKALELEVQQRGGRMPGEAEQPGREIIIFPDGGPGAINSDEQAVAVYQMVMRGDVEAGAAADATDDYLRRRALEPPAPAPGKIPEPEPSARPPASLSAPTPSGEAADAQAQNQLAPRTNGGKPHTAPAKVREARPVDVLPPVRRELSSEESDYALQMSVSRTAQMRREAAKAEMQESVERENEQQRAALRERESKMTAEGEEW
jgi:hypothetical protein